MRFPCRPSRFEVLLGLLLYAGFAVSRPSPKLVLHERRSTEPKDWTKDSRAHPDTPLRIRIGLAQSNLHLAEKHILDVSDPRSPNFGKHWSAERVAKTFAPSKETVDSVTDWLVEYGIPKKRHTFTYGM